MSLNIKINENYQNLAKNYLFAEIAKRVKAYKENNPDKKVISLGIGDVTRPLSNVVVNALKTASQEMGNPETFRGYP
ncbi:MAG: LL-diaminopimelate aminotransferase, partial [Clostridia bacterium]|nr:LL-diaminopimelate aminotransferase [Clostridia bacterium]